MSVSLVVSVHMQRCVYCGEKHLVEVRKDKQGRWTYDRHAFVCGRRPGVVLGALVDARDEHEVGGFGA